MRKIFSRKWWFATLLVIAGTLVLIRLGIWQLDRLEQRRAFNMQVESISLTSTDTTGALGHRPPFIGEN